jgi:hypothetical protein
MIGKLESSFDEKPTKKTASGGADPMNPHKQTFGWFCHRHENIGLARYHRKSL